MGERACILQHDKTTANGVVLDGLDDMGFDDRKLSYLGARVQCPTCNTIGTIAPSGERPGDHDLSGKQYALEDDVCRCVCDPAPRLIASQREWTIDA